MNKSVLRYPEATVMMTTTALRPTFAEFIGTFTLVLVGVGAVAAGQGLLVGAFSHGLVVTGMIYAFGAVSGAHLNPAVSLAMFASGRLPLPTLLGYWAAQFTAAIAASLLLRLLIGEGVAGGQTLGTLTSTAVWTAALFEAVQVFLLVTVIFHTAVYGRAGDFAGIAIGLTLASLILMGGVYTGASINPARTLGPALVAGDLSYVLPYFIGLFGGGALAGFIHRA